MYALQGYDNPVRRQYAEARKCRHQRWDRMAHGVKAPRDVLWIASHMIVGEKTVAAAASQAGAKSVLAYQSFWHVGPHPMRPRPSVHQIKEVVAGHFGLDVDELDSARRYRLLAYARHIAVYLCRTYTPLSLPVIGRHFGGRDHTTALNSVRRVEQDESRFAADLAAIKQVLQVV